MADYPIDIRVNTPGATQLTPLNRQLDTTDTRATAAASAVAGLTRAFVALGAGVALKSAINSTREFETAVLGVAKTTGLAGRDLDRFAASIAAISLEVPVSTAELLELAQAAGQMGVTGSENLEKFSATVAKLGRASDLAGSEAATALARILNVSGENIESIDTLASVIVSLGNSVAATESEIARMTTEVARATSTFGVSSAEAAGLSAAMTSIGIRAELGGSSVGRAMQQITSAVQAGGGELDKFANTLGINGQRLSETFQEDKLAAFQMFLESVGDLGLDAGNALDAVGLGGQEVAKTIIPLANNMGIYTRTQKLANDEVRNATALDDEFNATLGSLDSQIAITTNVIKQFGRSFGNELAPGINTSLKAFNEWAAEGDNLADAARTLIDVGTTIAVVYGTRVAGSMSVAAAAKLKDITATVASVKANTDYSRSAVLATQATRSNALAQEAQSAAALKSAASESRAAAISTSATLRETAAAKALAIQKLENIRIAARRTAGFATNATAMAELTAAETAAATAARTHAAAKRASSAAIAESTVAINAASAAQGKLNITSIGAAINTNAVTTRSTAAALAITAMGTAAKGASAAMALLGGPVGVAALAAGAIYLFARRNSESLQPVESHTERVARLREELGLLADQQNNNAKEELQNTRDLARARSVEIRERLRGLAQAEAATRARLEDPDDTGNRNLLRRNLAGQIQNQERLKEELQDTDRAYADANRALRLYADQTDEAAEKTANITTATNTTTASIDKVTQSLSNEIYQLREQAGQLDENAASYALYIATQEAGVALGSTEAEQIAELIRRRNQLTEAVRAQDEAERARESADQRIESLERQQESLRLTGEEQAAFNATSSLSADVTDTQRARIEELTRAIYGQNEALDAQRTIQQFEEDTQDPVEKLEARAKRLREANQRIFEEDMQTREEQKERELAIDQDLADQKLKLRQQSESRVRQATAQGLDALAGIIEAGGGKQTKAYRAVFAASRAFALADSIAKVAQAQAQALADPTAVTLPQKIANYTAVATAGAGLISSLQTDNGFKDGGYTGDIGVNDVAGVVHGREYVMPASRTSQYRDELEQMRRGSFGGNQRGGMNVKIINNVSDRVEATVSEAPDGSLITTIDERIALNTPGIVADQLGDPYSQTTETLESRYNMERR